MSATSPEPETVFLYVTVPTADEGRQIGRALVEAELCACANVFGSVTSFFRWEGRIQEEGEAVLIAKTQAKLVEHATQFITEAHSYTCPCVVALPIVGGNESFLQWIVAETGG